MAYKFHSGSKQMGPPLPLPWLRDSPRFPSFREAARPGWAPEGEVATTQEAGRRSCFRGGPWGPTVCHFESQWFLLFHPLLWKGPVGAEIWEWPAPVSSLEALTLGLRGSPSSPKVSWDGMSAVVGVYMRSQAQGACPHP